MTYCAWPKKNFVERLKDSMRSSFILVKENTKRMSGDRVKSVSHSNESYLRTIKEGGFWLS